MSKYNYTLDDVQNVFRILQNFRSPDASRFIIEKFYGRPAYELDTSDPSLPANAINGDPYVREKLHQFEQNPLEWVLGLDERNFNRLVNISPYTYRI